MFSPFAAVFFSPTTTGQSTPQRHSTPVGVNVTATQREGDITMQIIDHGHNDPLDYQPTETDLAIARQIRNSLPGGIGCIRAAEVLRGLNNARTGQQATAYTFDEVTAALKMGAAALEHLVA
jgi:hypothetical protein